MLKGEKEAEYTEGQGGSFYVRNQISKVEDYSLRSKTQTKPVILKGKMR